MVNGEKEEKEGERAMYNAQRHNTHTHTHSHMWPLFG
jgi:hypothetical protein